MFERLFDLKSVLIIIIFSAEDGNFASREIRLGSRGDSYYGNPISSQCMNKIANSFLY